jgi:hypothetical protein
MHVTTYYRTFNRSWPSSYCRKMKFCVAFLILLLAIIGVLSHDEARESEISENGTPSRERATGNSSGRNNGKRSAVRQKTNKNTSRARTNQKRRKLEQRPYYFWYTQDATLQTRQGLLDDLECPLGHYREFGSPMQGIPGGTRMDGCIKCSRGRFGNTTQLTSSNCTAPCPMGTFRATTGATSIEDCARCPEGTYGNTTGLTTSKCSGSCLELNNGDMHFYSKQEGLTSMDDCLLCPPGLFNKQCRSIWGYASPRDSILPNMAQGRTIGRSREPGKEYHFAKHGSPSSSQFPKYLEIYRNYERKRLEERRANGLEDPNELDPFLDFNQLWKKDFHF